MLRCIIFDVSASVPSKTKDRYVDIVKNVRTPVSVGVIGGIGKLGVLQLFELPFGRDFQSPYGLEHLIKAINQYGGCCSVACIPEATKDFEQIAFVTDGFCPPISRPCPIFNVHTPDWESQVIAWIG